MSVAAGDKSYMDAIDERARDALRLSSENARAVATLIVTTQTLSEDVDRMVKATSQRSEHCAVCRREVDAEITALGQTLRQEMKASVDTLHGRITALVNRTYWVAGFSAAAGVVAGVFVGKG